MKFRFRAIGPIQEADMELGDLTVIAGRNNTGKTYLAYSLYGFLSSWMGWPDLPRFLVEPTEYHPPMRQTTGFLSLKAMTQAVRDRGETRRVVDRETLAHERSALIEAIGASFSRLRLASVFSSPQDQFTDASCQVVIDTPFPAAVPVRRISFDPGGEWEYSYDGHEVVLRPTSPPRASASAAAVLPYVYARFLLAELPTPFVLSAERFGIALFYKELDFTKNKLVDLLQQLRDTKDDSRVSPYVLIDKTTSRYALPIKDNIDYTRSLATYRNKKSEVHDEKLFDEIRSMMDGYYRVSNDDIRFVSRRRKDNRFDVPLHRASSSARGLSDLYFFLRHVARRDHLLIVDEPESHLDTRNQIELARLLAAIVRSGLKVLVTTHSDYLLKEINNLIMCAELGNGSGPTPSGEDSPGLDGRRVRAYIASDGGLDACNVDRYGMEMPVFDTTIDEINRRSRRLAARIAESDGET